MANAFTLFGEIRVDSKGAVTALLQTEKGLKQTTQALTRTEQAAQRTGSASRRAAADIQQIGRASASSAGAVSTLGRGFSAIGLSAGAIAYGIGRAAVDIDNLMNVLRSATGSTESAKKKFQELNAVAQASPGVMTSVAVSTYALLKPMNVAETTIDSLIQSFGRIKLSLPTADMAQFSFNLNQLAVSFDKIDFKQAVENFPRFGEIVKKAFDLQSASDNIEGLIEELKKLQAAGKLTKDVWLKGIAEAINSDVNLGKLEDTLGTKFEKLTERLKIKVAPLGHLAVGTFLQAFDDWDKGAGKAFDGKMLYNVIVGKLQQQITGAAVAVVPSSYAAFDQVGAAIDRGVVSGIAGGQSGVINAAVQMAYKAYIAAKDILGIQSPSKKFFEIGKDVAQGFIDGIASMRTGVYASMASLLDVSGLTGLGKKDAAGVQLLNDLIKELDDLTPRTRSQAIAALLTADAYKNLNKEVRLRIELAAAELTKLEKLKEYYDSIRDRFQNVNADSEGEGGGRSISDSIQGMGIGTSLDVEANPMAAMVELLRGAPAQIKPQWEDFWATMRERMEYFKATLPSIKQSIGENLISGIAAIGDVFANAVMQWDGTAKGFFKSLAQGFRQLVSQLLAELVRLMIMKAVMSLITGAVGGAMGGGGSHGGSSVGGGGGGPTGGTPDFASGGLVRGPGSGTSDSIAARLSNGEFVMSAKAVDKYGADFFAGMNNATPGSRSYGSTAPTFNNTVTINLTGGSGNAQSAEQIKRAVLQALNKTQHRNK